MGVVVGLERKHCCPATRMRHGCGLLQAYGCSCIDFRVLRTPVLHGHLGYDLSDFIGLLFQDAVLLHGPPLYNDMIKINGFYI